jgi:protein involved in polysaccharide export with SLBB domain
MSGTALCVAAGNPCRAQDGAPATPGRQEFETRAQIEEQAKTAEAQHRTGEAWLLRQRLEKGDFQDGDRIVLNLQGNALIQLQASAQGTAGQPPKGFGGIPETLTVRTGRHLEFPMMSDLSLDGVLRSELNDKLTTHFAQYIREPTVRSTPLVRIAVLGSIARPGYVYTLADNPLSDVIMQAGGPSGTADMAGIVIRRGADIIWDQQDTRAALADGMSLDRLHLRAGDEIVIPERHDVSWFGVFTACLSAGALLLAVFRR